MSSDDSGGFLAKVARLVRRPGAGWADSGPASGAGLSDRQALKEAIERKKRNDFVRKREFDMLRAIRRREQGAREQVARPSFFQSSHPSQGDGRELTIRKIDEIEAQMSTHWWQQKPGDDGRTPERLQAPATRAPGGAGPAHLQAQAFDTTSDWSGTIQGPQLTTQPALEDQWPAASRPSRRKEASHSLPVMFSDEGDPGDGAPATPTAWAGLARQICREVPALEAAAVHFINGDDTQAEKLLKDAVQLAAAGESRALALSVLLDFYRATDRRGDYESCVDAWTRAGGHNRPLPPWQPLGADGQGATGASRAELAVWVCPPQFDAKAVASLQEHVRDAGQTLVLDWSVLSSADPDSAGKLQGLLDDWSQQALVIHWVGHANLRRRLQASTPSGRRENHAVWWQLRLSVLRLMGRSDEFDLTALDYCVTYGVTPPDWTAPECASEMHERWPPDSPGQVPQVLRLPDRLKGELSGLLASLEQQAGDAEVLRLDCSALRRVDLVAAGALLQWGTALKGRHKRVVLEQVHRLLAIALHVVGVDETLQLRVPTDG